MPPAAIIHAMIAPKGPVAAANVRGSEKIPAPTIDPTTIAVNVGRENVCFEVVAMLPLRWPDSVRLPWQLTNGAVIRLGIDCADGSITIPGSLITLFYFVLPFLHPGFILLIEILPHVHTYLRRVIVVDGDIADFSDVEKLRPHGPAALESPHYAPAEFVQVVVAAEFVGRFESGIKVFAVFVEVMVFPQPKQKGINPVRENKVERACQAGDGSVAVGNVSL